MHADCFDPEARQDAFAQRRAQDIELGLEPRRFLLPDLRKGASLLGQCGVGTQPVDGVRFVPGAHARPGSRAPSGAPRSRIWSA